MNMNKQKIVAINPGSTSTKIAVFLNEQMIAGETVVHDAAELARFADVSDQLEYRRDTILHFLQKRSIRLDDCAAFAGRGGGLVSCEGGVYEINEKMIEHASSGKYGGNHPARLGVLIAGGFARQFGARAFIVNGPDTDEFCDEARVTGFADIFRASHIHALNQKQTAVIAAKELGVDYACANFVVAHLGGGVSVTAHRSGKMMDSNDIIDGDGPMTPTRSGALPARELMDLCYSGRWTREQMYQRLTKRGGFVDHLGTSEMTEVVKMVNSGNRYAALVYNAFIYQVAKSIGAMAAALDGRVDAILLTGGIARDTGLVKRLTDKVGFVAPVYSYPGEFEMEALAAGACRVLIGAETAKVYTGIPVFSNFNSLKETGEKE